MSACAFAFLLFFTEHHDIFKADPVTVIKASFIDEGGLVVTFTAPYEMRRLVNRHHYARHRAIDEVRRGIVDACVERRVVHRVE